MMQRSVEDPDLLIAAAAERAGLPLVHDDTHCDTIADITRQPVRWVAPRGSL
jgi:predicted nucleic acid-binding protein